MAPAPRHLQPQFARQADLPMLTQLLRARTMCAQADFTCAAPTILLDVVWLAAIVRPPEVVSCPRKPLSTQMVLSSLLLLEHPLRPRQLPNMDLVQAVGTAAQLIVAETAVLMDSSAASSVQRLHLGNPVSRRRLRLARLLFLPNTPCSSCYYLHFAQVLPWSCYKPGTTYVSICTPWCSEESLTCATHECPLIQEWCNSLVSLGNERVWNPIMWTTN